MDSITTEDRQRFLAALADCGDTRKAARTTKVARTGWYALRDSDPEFAAAWRLAEERATDVLEGEAMRQALNGVDEAVFHQGRKAGKVRKRSEALLVLLLKARRPERYSDKARPGVTSDLRAVLDAVNGRTRTLLQDRDDH